MSAAGSVPSVSSPVKSGSAASSPVKPLVAGAGLGVKVPTPPRGPKPQYLLSSPPRRELLSKAAEHDREKKEGQQGRPGNAGAAAAPAPAVTSPTAAAAASTSSSTPAQAESQDVSQRVSALLRRVNEADNLEASPAELSALYAEAAECFKLVQTPPDIARLAAIVLHLPPLAEYATLSAKCCKRIFQLSSSKEHDTLMQALLRPLLSVAREALRRDLHQLNYVLAALANLSIDEAGQARLLAHDAVPALTPLLKPEAYQTLASEHTARVKMLSELAVVLRNLANGLQEGQEDAFLKADTIPAICALVTAFPQEAGLLLNLSRVLSKLSLHERLRDVLSEQQGALKALMTAIDTHHTKLPLCTRVCFLFGNLTVSNERNRLFLFEQCDGMRVLCGLLRRTQERDAKLARLLQQPQQDEKYAAMARDNDDLAVKLVRAIANMCIHPAIGPQFAANEAMLGLVQLLQRKSAETHEELVLNLVSAITNLSFYYMPASNSSGGASAGHQNVLFAARRDVLAALMPHLFSSNLELVRETVRALGNLSRDPAFRVDMHKARVDEAMAVLLGHTDARLLFSVCGVMVNIAGDSDPEVRAALRTDGEGQVRLVELFERLADGDEFLLMDVACKALLNLSQIVRGDGTGRAFGPALCKRLPAVLAHVIGRIEAGEFSVAPPEGLSELLRTLLEEIQEEDGVLEEL